MSEILDELPTRPTPTWGVSLPTKVLLLAIFGQAIVVQAMMSAASAPAPGAPAGSPSSPPESWMLAVPIALSYAVLIGLIAVVARVKFGRRLRALPGFGRATARAHVLGLFVGLALYGFNVAFALVVDVGIEQTELFHAVETLADLAVLALPVVVLAPIFEELLFRGLYFHAFEARGARDAIVLSATLFAVVHFLTYSKAPLAVLPVFVVGLANGWLRARTGSIEPGITSHAVFNALGLVSWALQLSQRG